MSNYVLRRLALVIPLLFLITVVNYVIYNLAPGDPVSAMINPAETTTLTAEDLQDIREAMGLDKPMPVRYVIWLGQVLRGNLGYSFWFHRPVLEIIGEGLNSTIPLTLSALLISTLAGIVLGILSALKPYSLLDYALTAFAFTGVAIPGFFFALALIYVFCLQLGILPTGGIVTPGVPPTMLDRLVHLILPAGALAYESVGSLLRYTRSSMLEVMGQDYIRSARAKGLAEKVVIARHGFRNSLLPVITVIGMRLPGLFGGAVLIETVFNYRGLGSIIVNATEQRDYPLLMGCLLMTATLVLLSNLLADMAYAWADPRIRYA